MEQNMPSSKKVFFTSESESKTESESGSESESDVKSKLESNSILHMIIPPRPFLSYVLISTKSYVFDSWSKFFPSGQVKLSSLLFNPSWFEFFRSVDMAPIIKKIESDLTREMKKNNRIVPFPELIFNIMNLVDIENIRVVICGQDPYPGDLNGIPFAMGPSFSVPIGIKRPVSLNNIYNNLVKYGHLKSKPETGCLIGWILQGCFMLNAALTTFASEPDAHGKIWAEFTKKLMTYINLKLKKCIFVAWGANAFRMCEPIDRSKHVVTASSHPSGHSCSKTMSGTHNNKTILYDSFDSVDHFGKINSHLKLNGFNEIIWDVIL